MTLSIISIFSKKKSFVITLRLKNAIVLVDKFLNGDVYDADFIIALLLQGSKSHFNLESMFNMLITIGLNNKKEKLLYTLAYKLYQKNKLLPSFINSNLRFQSTTKEGIEEEFRKYCKRPIKFVDRFMMLCKQATEKEITPYMKLIILTENI